MVTLNGSCWCGCWLEPAFTSEITVLIVVVEVISMKSRIAVVL